MGIELLYSGVQLKVLDLDSSSDITVFLPVFSSGKNGMNYIDFLPDLT